MFAASSILTKKETPIANSFKAALSLTLPLWPGFLFFGFAYGAYMHAVGFSVIYTFLMSLLIFAGSLEFVVVNMLLSPFAPLEALLVSLAVQARHIFYGISLLSKYKGLGLKRYYMMFGLCDEAFAINYTAKVAEGADRGYQYFFVTLMFHFYWVSGSVLGNLIAGSLPFDLTGINFVVPAMFTVIFMEQCYKEKSHITAYVGVLASIACLFVFGAHDFMLPALLSILFILTVFRRPIERRQNGGKSHDLD